jgi:iron complex transport system substrate-binding protein
MKARRWLTTLAAAALLAGACGQEAPELAGDSASGYPVTIRAANGEVVIRERPERIISLSPTSTEMLFAIGAGDQVIAVDDFSNYPPEAPRTNLSGHQPNAEAVAQRRPDLVVVANDLNDIVASLNALDIPVVLHPAAAKLEDSYEQIEQLGAATGHVAEAARVVGAMQSRVRELTRRVEDAPRLTYYHELDQKLFSVTSNTFIGQVYSLANLENIADEAATQGNDYPQLSAEFIIRADPDLIFLADTKCCGQSAETVARRPGWAGITAVRTGAVVELDDDIASRWGPRIVELLEVVVDTVSKLEGARR